MRARPDSILLILVVCMALASVTSARAQQRQSLTTLYQNEMAQAVRDLNWKGPKLSDNTLLALCASGVSWMPKWQSPALFQGAGKHLRYADAKGRLAGYLAAKQSDDNKLAIPYALSIALDPDDLGRAMWTDIRSYLGSFDEDYDDILMGIEEAPRDLPLLSLYQYAAADLLVRRASPQLIPFLLTMASSGDAYLRSRAVAALGIAAYDPATGPFWFGDIPIKARSISANQRRMVTYTLRRATTDGNYRVRAAAAFAMGLAGGQGDIPFLEMLTGDPAFTLVSSEYGRRTYIYPVRKEAVEALSRLGKRVSCIDTVSGDTREEVSAYLKGGRDVTHDTSGMRKDQIRHVPPISINKW
ncbi:MAG: hypothetical protein ACP5VE_14560 [Chthonomonadales bacterium]